MVANCHLQQGKNSFGKKSFQHSAGQHPFYLSAFHRFPIFLVFCDLKVAFSSFHPSVFFRLSGTFPLSVRFSVTF